MHRLHLLNHKGLLLTPDTAEALEQLIERASAKNWRVRLTGPQAGSLTNDPLSLVPAGREIQFHLEHPEVTNAQAALNAAWGFAVPLGFSPKLRYPLVGTEDNVFHFFGPWTALYDRMLSEGRGHLAWPSVCAAAQCDVGVWKGTKTEERFLQAQLHRLGRNCGPVDGEIGPRTAEVIETLGLKRASLVDVNNFFRASEPPPINPEIRKTGHIAIHGRQLNVIAYGGIRVVKSLQGATLTIDGPGRVVLDVGGVIS